MAQNPIVPVPLERKRVVSRIEEYLHVKGINKKQLAKILGYSSPQSVSNFLQGEPLKDESGNVVGVKPMSMAVLGQWCKKMGYPIEDLLNDRPYASPGSITALENGLKRLRDEVMYLREEIENLKKKI